MAPLNRDAQRGRLLTLKEDRNTLLIEIDAAVKAICVAFEPMDLDLRYVYNIMPNRLEIHVATIARKKKQLDRILTEIKALAQELNESAD